MITPSFSITATERVLPKLALNFTSASLDPRITFTRAGGTATRTNSSGYIELMAADTPRFDFNPLTLVCRGLLIEESRVNTLTYSQAIDNAAWAKVAGSVPVDTTTSPDGTSNALKFIENTATAQHNLQSATVTGVTAGATLSASFYVKAAGRTSGWLQVNASNFSAGFRAVFNLSTVTTSTATFGAGSSASSSSITDVGNGWYRVTVTGIVDASSTSIKIVLFLTTSAGASSYLGDGVSGVWMWGAQLEVGVFSTSYIPTDASQVTRTADVAVMTGSNFSDWYSAGAGSIVASALPSAVSGTQPAVQFDDNTANEIIVLQGNTTNPEFYIVDGGSPQAQIDAGTIAANTTYNLGAAWDTNNCAAAVNGGAAVTDNTASIPTVTQARLGSNGTNYLNGRLQTVRYWPQRITNAEVQAFSK